MPFTFWLPGLPLTYRRQYTPSSVNMSTAPAPSLLRKLSRVPGLKVAAAKVPLPAPSIVAVTSWLRSVSGAD